MERNYLAHRQGDAANAVLGAADYNFRRLIRWLSDFSPRWLWPWLSEFRLKLAFFTDDYLAAVKRKPPKGSRDQRCIANL